MRSDASGRTLPQPYLLFLGDITVMEGQATRELAKCSAELHLPVADPVRGGAEVEQLVSACLATEGLQ